MMRTREPMTLQLYRPNIHVRPASVATDVVDLLMGTTLVFVLLVLAVLLMGGF